MKIIFLILLALSVNASSILTIYRTNGVEGIEKQMDLELTQREYWDSYLKTVDTTFGYIESYSSILTCNKEKSTLSLYEFKDKKFHLVKDYSAFTGKIKGEKSKEGDLRTPIGIYNLTQKLSKVDSFYGPLAFVTSYPNLYDKYKGREGHGIWIHGLPLNQERDDFTKGCIAIDNTNLECLDKTIDIEKTMLIINPAKTQKNISKDKLAQILSQLYMWRYTWLYNDIVGYLNFYANDFVRSDGMDIERFTDYKKRVFGKKEDKTIIFNNINVVPYPNLKDTYQVTFKEFYKSDSFKFSGDKTLLLRLTEDNKIKIFTEK